MDTYVVLGCGNNSRNMVRVKLLLETLKLSDANGVRVIFTGHNGEATKLFLMTMAYGTCSRISKIKLESKAYDTFTNFTNSLELINRERDTENVYIITDASHIWRSVMLARFVNWRFFKSSFDILVPSNVYSDTNKQYNRLFKNIKRHTWHILGVKKL